MNNLIIRKIRKNEYKLLEDFLYEAIFIPKGTRKMPREIINNKKLQVYIKDFGIDKNNICVVVEYNNKLEGSC